MKTPDVLREFDKRFLDKNTPSGVARKYSTSNLLAYTNEIKAFIVENLNERGEMIAKAIEENHYDNPIGDENFYEFAKDIAAAISRSYKE